MEAWSCVRSGVMTVLTMDKLSVVHVWQNNVMTTVINMLRLVGLL